MDMPGNEDLWRNLVTGEGSPIKHDRGRYRRSPPLGSAPARLAIEASYKLLEAIGHGRESGPWLPVGAGVHAGHAYVGAVGTQDTVADFTAMGDAVNVCARLASVAEQGEVLISEAAHSLSGLDLTNLAQRRLDLKGRSTPVEVRVFRAGRA